MSERLTKFFLLNASDGISRQSAKSFGINHPRRFVDPSPLTRTGGADLAQLHLGFIDRDLDQPRTELGLLAEAGEILKRP